MNLLVHTVSSHIISTFCKGMGPQIRQKFSAKGGGGYPPIPPISPSKIQVLFSTKTLYLALFNLLVIFFKFPPKGVDTPLTEKIRKAVFDTFPNIIKQSYEMYVPKILVLSAMSSWVLGDNTMDNTGGCGSAAKRLIRRPRWRN